MTSNVLHALGEACLALGLRDEAQARFLAATSALPVRPEAWLSLGNMSLERDEPAEAERCFREALTPRPDFVEALNNLGNALVAQLRLQEARESYERALALRPDSANTAFAYALALLLDGDFAAGWRHFEARREAGPLRWNYQRRPALKQWQPGMALEGKRVLLMAEQGAGDIIQFVRYAPLLAALGTEVVLELPREMHAVFADLPGIARIIGLEDPDPDCDVACPLLSLPLYSATVSDTIPQAVPYATVPPVRMEPWRAGPRRCAGEVERLDQAEPAERADQADRGGWRARAGSAVSVWFARADPSTRTTATARSRWRVSRRFLARPAATSCWCSSSCVSATRRLWRQRRHCAGPAHRSATLPIPLRC